MIRRNCCYIISLMKQEIPKEKVKFHKDLDWNYNDASYKAPEETLQWQRTSETLIKHINIPSEEWEFRVLSIFTTKTVEQIRDSFKHC